MPSVTCNLELCLHNNLPNIRHISIDCSLRQGVGAWSACTSSELLNACTGEPSQCTGVCAWLLLEERSAKAEAVQDPK